MADRGITRRGGLGRRHVFKSDIRPDASGSVEPVANRETKAGQDVFAVQCRRPTMFDVEWRGDGGPAPQAAGPTLRLLDRTTSEPRQRNHLEAALAPLRVTGLKLRYRLPETVRNCRP